MGALAETASFAEPRPSPEAIQIDRRQLSNANPPLHDVVFGKQLLDFYRGIFKRDVRHFDHIWCRVIQPGLGTPPHADAVYMNRGTLNIPTAWIPYGYTIRELGGIRVEDHTSFQK